MERYRDSIDRIKEYVDKTHQKGYRYDAIPSYKYSIDLKELAIFVGIESEYEAPPEDVKNIIEEAAMKFVLQKEIEEGRRPDDSPGRRNEHYDIYSYDPSTGEERFIEVKGHAGMQIFAELTEEEFKFGKEKGDKYWLYIVFNLTTVGDLANAKYLRFRNAVNTMNVKIKGNARYILTP